MVHGTDLYPSAPTARDKSEKLTPHKLLNRITKKIMMLIAYASDDLFLNCAHQNCKIFFSSIFLSNSCHHFLYECST